MKRIGIKIAYDGTCYRGFQIQKGLPTIEGEVSRALSDLLGEKIRITGASRTDAGVHAKGNVAVFDTTSTIPAERYPFALLRFLPCDIRVMEGKEVPFDFNPRKVPCIKTYEYAYSCGRIEDPFTRRFSSFSPFVPDVGAMSEAAKYLVGEHDFTSFANPSSWALSGTRGAIRKIYSIDLDQTPGGAGVLIKIRIRGDGFLYNMVRIISGTLMNVGKGLWTPQRVLDALNAKDRGKAGPTAQARGLTLVGIKFAKIIKD